MESKKLLILQILEILKANSCKEKPITQTEIGKILEREGTPCDRKTISRNIDYLTKFGYNIIKIPGGGCYFDEKEFSEGELAFLVDSIYLSPAISQNQALALIEKLKGKIGYLFAKQFDNVSGFGKITRTDNENFFNNISKINRAIARKKKICFIYNHYDIDKNFVPSSPDEYTVNPYFIIVSQGKFFLVCNNVKYFDVSIFRIDFMTDVSVLSANYWPITQTTNYRDGVTLAQFANEHIYMCDDQSVKAKLKLSSQDIISEIVDRFGKDVEFSKNGDTIYATVVASEKALIYWSLQYEKDVEIVEPLETRDLLKTILRKIVCKYQDE